MLETLANDDDKYSSRAGYLIGEGGSNINKPEMYFRVIASAPFLGAQALNRYPAYSPRSSLN